MRIRNGKPTIKDIAERASVSLMTVSRILNNKGGASPATREKVLQIADEMGYVANPMARGLRGLSNTIGVVITDITRPFAGELLQQLSLAADHFNYGLMLYSQGDKEHEERSEHYASLLVNGINDGVILNSMVDYEVYLNHLKQNDIPFVLLDNHEYPGEPKVVPTNRRGMVDATRHLLALGHRRIGFISGPRNHSAANERLRGYFEALKEVGIPVDHELIHEGDFSQIAGFQLGRKILSMDHTPTAIIASNDGMAFGVMEAIRERGLQIGVDISLIGFDDVPMAALVDPPLTTVRQPLEQIAIEALELLINLIERRPPARLQRELPTELIIRQTTTYPKILPKSVYGKVINEPNGGS
jgi:DNA-binding LacI/PurR family transcriptional regulator